MAYSDLLLALVPLLFSWLVLRQSGKPARARRELAKEQARRRQVLAK